MTAAALAALVAVLAVGTNALLTDSEAIPGNTISTGDLDLTTAPTTAAITVTDLLPGDRVVRSITVGNAGSADLRYAMQSTTTEDTLAPQLDLTIKTGVASCTLAGFDSSGTVRYGPDDLGSSLTDDLLGSPATGPDPGDRVLTSGASEALCLEVELPLASDNTFQARSSTATFDFIAEQTANNP